MLLCYSLLCSPSFPPSFSLLVCFNSATQFMQARCTFPERASFMPLSLSREKVCMCEMSCRPTDRPTDRGIVLSHNHRHIPPEREVSKDGVPHRPRRRALIAFEPLFTFEITRFISPGRRSPLPRSLWRRRAICFEAALTCARRPSAQRGRTKPSPL